MPALRLDSARILSISSGAARFVGAKLGGAVQLVETLLDVAAHLGFDESERKEEGLVEDLYGEELVRVGVAGGDAVAIECAGARGEVDAVVAEAIGRGGELGLGEGNFNHASSVWGEGASGRFSTELCRGGETVS